MSGPSKETLDQIRAVVGPKGWTDDPQDMAPYLKEWRGRYQGATPLVVKPSTTLEVAEVVRICAATQTAIVPQGGNTGLVGGQIPSGDEILLSLERMKLIRGRDAQNATITVEAGLPLEAAQDAATEMDLQFATSLASEGSATIGGIVSTNAGGTNVLRYGMTRDQVLGLEVVLPSGEIWNGLTGLRKDNTGYDLKHLFIGAEGTLGIVTAATFRLFPAPKSQLTAFCAVTDPEMAVGLLGHFRNEIGAEISTFEIMPRLGLEFVLKHVEGAQDPLEASYSWYVLLEIDCPQEDQEALMSSALEANLLSDAAVATSMDQVAALRGLRASLSEVQKLEGGSIKHDISVPVSAIAAFLSEATKAVERACPGIRPIPFGHLGDGNIHFNLSQPSGMDRDLFLAQWEGVNRIVHDIVANHGGSISAEHGIGQMKREEILRYKSEAEIEMMKGIKRALDPLNIINPGKLILP